MAIVTHFPSSTPHVDPITVGEVGVARVNVMAIRGEIVEESVARVIEEKIYVAVGKVVKDCKSLLIWALQNSGGKKICILHVHQPALMIPLMGTKFPISSLKEDKVREFRETERGEMVRLLDEYLLICGRMGVRAETVYIERDSIEKGILELVSREGIRKLVMGAAADKNYSRRMMDIKSKKAITVQVEAAASCSIQFICKGHLIHTREDKPDEFIGQVTSSSLQASAYKKNGHSNILRSQSIALGQKDHTSFTKQAQNLFRRGGSFNVGGQVERLNAFSSPDAFGSTSTPPNRLDVLGSSDESVGSSGSASGVSHLSPYSPTRLIDMNSISLVGTVGDTESSIISSAQEVSNGNMYDQLEQALEETDYCRREAFEEAMRRAKAEKYAIDAMRRAKASEVLYSEELKQRQEIEEARAREKDILVKIKDDRDRVKEELHHAHNQISLLENEVMESEQVVKELEQKIISAVELLQSYKKEQEELQNERNIALKQAEELKKSRVDPSSIHMHQFFSEFSFSEIEQATNNFDPSNKIGEGGYGSIYKGVLRCTKVAIKMLHSHSMQGPSEFQQEVGVLSKVRHQNLVTLIGACPEALSLIYEYLPNGSLEDRLSCKDNSPPLSWQTRICIATELCSVLMFLHSCKPHSIIHGDLKPANVLLDANFMSKLSDFGICRLLSSDGCSSDGTTEYHKTSPKGTFAYMDPEFIVTGELTPKADVYSFGIILLQLLTGRPALKIAKIVQCELDKGNLKSLLDTLAGDWPFVQAEQLACLAMRCCEMNRRDRPDLASDVWKVLEPMRASCGGSSSLQLGPQENFQPPSYFICPIFLEVMRDPHVAADGFTYEAEAMRGWLESGRDTSPMTNLKLAHHDLIPNRALRSAIQEWLQLQ